MGAYPGLMGATSGGLALLGAIAGGLGAYWRLRLGVGLPGLRAHVHYQASRHTLARTHPASTHTHARTHARAHTHTHTGGRPSAECGSGAFSRIRDFADEIRYPGVTAYNPKP